MSRNHLARYMREEGYKPHSNIHHIIGQVNKDMYNVFLPDNQIRVDRSQHSGYNQYVRDKQSPRGLFETAYEWTNPVLSEYAETLLRTLMEMPDEELYQRKFLKKVAK